MENNDTSAKSAGFVFSAGSEAVLTIYTDGTVKLGQGFYPDQAGEMAAKALINYLEIYTKENPIFNPEGVADRIYKKLENTGFDQTLAKKIIFEEISRKSSAT